MGKKEDKQIIAELKKLNLCMEKMLNKLQEMKDNMGGSIT